jgi:ATP-binding cassette subfamily B protein
MADRILVLDKGEILEEGSHEELLKKKNRYAELFNLQAMGYQ